MLDGVEQTNAGKGPENSVRPYWNELSAKLNPAFWLPTEEVLRTLSPNTSSPVTLRDSWYSFQIYTNPEANALPRMEIQGSDEEVSVTKSRKIRIYPTREQKILFSQWFGASRYSFNQTVSFLKQPGTKAAWKSIKGDILGGLPLWSKEIPYQIKSVAVRDCCVAVGNAKRKTKATGVPNFVKFKSRKNPVQSCYIPKSAIKEAGVYYTLSKELKWSETLPEEYLDARLVKHNGRYYVTVPYKAPTLKAENQGRVVALDPGIRSFISFYSEQSCGKIGSGDIKRIFRLCRVLDRIQSRLAKEKSRFFERSRLKKACGRIRWKIQDLISELHHKTALFLVRNFDVILLPDFEVSQMVRRLDRKIRTKSARQMMSLCHFRFKQFIKHKAFEHGKTVFDVCEAYTSKTVSWTGELVTIGGAKFIRSKKDGEVMDRDLNGARGIFLRALGDTPILRNFVRDVLLLNSVEGK